MNQNEKLSVISEVFSDGYLFIKMKFFIEECNKNNYNGVEDLNTTIERMYRLCSYIKSNNLENDIL